MYFVKKILLSKTFYQKLMSSTILDLLICISENVKKNLFFGGFRKKKVFAVRGGGGSERYGHVRN